tara:strand:- start:1157 stop:1483 length:327 start_codon:yes stop_codon:yes gene_type:complete
MGFNVNKEHSFDDEDMPEGLAEFLEDVGEQTDFHKNNILTKDIDHVEEVIKRFMLMLVDLMEEDSAQASIPILTALGESVVELRQEVDSLRSQLIEKKLPPPKNFEEN